MKNGGNTSVVCKDHSSTIRVGWQQDPLEHYWVQAKGDSNSGGRHGEGSHEWALEMWKRQKEQNLVVIEYGLGEGYWHDPCVSSLLSKVSGGTINLGRKLE